VGNVVVTYADGTIDLWTLKGNCKLPKVSSEGAVGWVVCEMQSNSGSLKLYDGLAIGSSLTVNFRGRIVANLRAAKPFIEDWAFDTDGRHAIVKSRLAHGTAVIERFGLHDGPPEAAVEAYQEGLPDWAQAFGEGSSGSESTANVSEPVVTAHADDATIKKRLVGTWKAYDETIVLKSDGTRITSGTDSSGRFSVREKWDVRCGNGHPSASCLQPKLVNLDSNHIVGLRLPRYEIHSPDSCLKRVLKVFYMRASATMDMFTWLLPRVVQRIRPFGLDIRLTAASVILFSTKASSSPWI